VPIEKVIFSIGLLGQRSNCRTTTTTCGGNIESKKMVYLLVTMVRMLLRMVIHARAGTRSSIPLNEKSQKNSLNKTHEDENCLR
jgi:uncharacterized membrane protein